MFTNGKTVFRSGNPVRPHTRLRWNTPEIAATLTVAALTAALTVTGIMLATDEPAVVPVPVATVAPVC